MIDKIDTKFQIYEMLERGYPEFEKIEHLIELVTKIQDKKMNEIIDVVNKLNKNK